MSVTDITARLAFTYAEAAELIGCSPRTIWQLVADGELHAARIGRLVRIPRGELERYLAERSAAKQPA